VQFDVRAFLPAEGPRSIRIDADTRAAAEAQAAERGLVVLEIREHGAQGRLFTRRQRFPLLQFAQELLSLHAAGLALMESLDTLGAKEAASGAGWVIAALRNELAEGRSLSKALERLPAEFPPLFIATVRAAEKTGDLAESLQRFIDYQQRMNAVRSKIISASIYPVLLMIAGTLVTLFLLGYVVPRFSHVYADSGRELPLLSQMLMQWGQAVEGRAGWLAVALGAVVVTIYFVVRSAGASLASLAWRIPGIGERLLVYQLARFYRTVGMLLRGGTPIVTALDMSGQLLHPGLRPRLARARRRIAEGLPISAAMSEAELTTPVASRMLLVGERSGEMANMMERIAGFCDDELSRWIDWFTRLFEPILMCVIGLVIGVIVVLMYLPIFELAGSIQ
jgi:general secretion pathway protein F